MANSKACKGDTIVIVGGPNLPEDWEQYIGEEFTVDSITNHGEIFVELSNGNQLILKEEEYDIIGQDIYTKQKRKLDV